jgi:hypothetical protein
MTGVSCVSVVASPMSSRRIHLDSRGSGISEYSSLILIKV